MLRAPFLKRLAGFFLSLLLLSGCGGGSGSSSDPPPRPITISPVSASVTVSEGSSGALSTTITVDTQLVTGVLYLGFRDTGGSIAENISVFATSSNTAQANFQSLGTLSIGTHSGVIEIYACKDAACAQLYSSTPATLSYQISVQPLQLIATVAPSSVNITMEEGDQSRVSLLTQVSLAGAYPTLGVGQSGSVFKLPTSIGYAGTGGYQVDLTVSPATPSGTYTGSIFIYVCGVYSTTCDASSDVSQSPVVVPYTVVVSPLTRLPAVPTVTGLPEWGTYQGNAGHTGFVPVTLNPARFSARWSWNNPNSSTGTLTHASTGSGKLVLASSGYFSNAYLYALNESDGSLAWQYGFGSIFSVNPPAVEDGRVFVTSSGHSDTFMWSFDVNDGTFKYKTAFDSQWEHYLAPVVRDGYVYTEGGSLGGMYRFNEAKGRQSWFAQLQQYELWSPAVDDHYAYAHTGYEFVVLNKETGERFFSVGNQSFNWRGYSLNIAPVLPNDGSVLVVDGVFNFGTASQNHLIRYTLAAQGESWRVDGQFGSDPVVAGTTLYVVNSATNAVEARSVTTGQLLWSWVPTNTGELVSNGNLVLTNNLVFVRTSAGTRAIDLSTRQSVWNHAATGRMALSSNKILYIVGDQQVNAITLD